MRRKYQVLLYIILFITTFASLNSLFEVGLAMGEDGVEYVFVRIISPEGFGRWTMYAIQIFQLILVVQEIKRLALWGIFSSRKAMMLQIYFRIFMIYIVDISIKNLALVWETVRWDFMCRGMIPEMFIGYNMSICKDTLIMMLMILLMGFCIKNREIL